MAGYIPSFVSELDYLRDFSLGPEFSDEHGRLQSWYIDNDEKLLKFRIFGVVAETVLLNDGALQVRSAPLQGRFTSARSKLCRPCLLGTKSRRVSEEVSWVLGSADPLECAICVRIQSQDNVMSNIDVVAFRGKDELTIAIAEEAPLVSGDFQTVDRGALLMCVAEPLRVDYAADSGELERMYGLVSSASSVARSNASAVAEKCRNADFAAVRATPLSAIRTTKPISKSVAECDPLMVDHCFNAMSPRL
ncbi:hypothetical protein DFH06DRAFT_1127888 [Mycena polygramma]|nr:hypothetical protein DFH06DRAFT_1129743 [Mycena polygramma]KAJ7664475.1 hypothetical protein DFH06DRAFT_1127888 [Mycena polygramma]